MSSAGALDVHQERVLEHLNFYCTDGIPGMKMRLQILAVFGIMLNAVRLVNIAYLLEMNCYGDYDYWLPIQILVYPMLGDPVKLKVGIVGHNESGKIEVAMWEGSGLTATTSLIPIFEQAVALKILSGSYPKG